MLELQHSVTQAFNIKNGINLPRSALDWHPGTLQDIHRQADGIQSDASVANPAIDFKHTFQRRSSLKNFRHR
jgi:hypothetical protein